MTENNWITNDKKQVAMRYVGINQKLMSAPSTKQYVFVPHHNICIAWVDKCDVPFFLQKKIGCCGNAKKGFALATQEQIDTWNA